MDKIKITPQTLLIAGITGVQAITKELGVEVTTEDIQKNLHPHDMAQIASYCTRLIEDVTGKRVVIDKDELKKVLTGNDNDENFKDNL